ncbi:capsid cement protein [Shewanella sp.]|uniref:capsid cement protein n=1 Tax=Shewanella sp. TaxID=50422 RepID=UPI003F3AF34A
MNNQGLVKTFIAATAIPKFTVVKLNAAANSVALAVDPTDPLIGVSAEPADIAAGARVDVVFSGITAVKAGGTITKGAWLTVNASGAVVAATSTNERIGRALEAAVTGDVISIEIAKN